MANTYGPWAQPAPRPKPVNPLGGVLSDPSLVASDLARNRAIQQANAALRQQRSQALIGYGDPTLARTLGIGVDPNTAPAAAANQYSTLAGLRLAHQKAQAGILNSLAGRGILHSGELGYQQGQEAHQYGQANYDAQAALLQQLGAYLQQYLGQSQGANDSYNQALLNAYQNYGRNVLQGVY